MINYVIGLNKKELDTPVLCLDSEKLEENIAEMAEFLKRTGVSLRPHTKTHKCPTIAWMQLRAGAIGVTCAKMEEAEVMARSGIRDILIANQIVAPRKIKRLVSLASSADIMVAVDQPQNIQDISDAAAARGVTVRMLIEVDVGMHRCGTEGAEEALVLARQILEQPGVQFAGVMGYEGHAVMIEDDKQREAAAKLAMSKLVGVRDSLAEQGIEVGIVSGGGTGTYLTTGSFPGVTEIQAGSYATMDGRYRQVGIPFHHALTVLAGVISTDGDDHAVTDAGLKTLTSEFGLPRVLRPKGWEVVKFSEEHSALKRIDGEPLKPGDTVELIPSHGCTTINLHDYYVVTRKDAVEAVWPIAARGAVH